MRTIMTKIFEKSSKSGETRFHLARHACDLYMYLLLYFPGSLPFTLLLSRSSLI